MDQLSEGFDIDTWKNLGRDQNGATKILQNMGPKENGDFGPFYAHNRKLEGTQKLQTADPDNYLNIDYEMHFGTKFDYLFFQSSRLLQATEIQLLQNQCEQERTQLLTNLMLAPENPRLAGYMLTGNRSMFLETDRSVACSIMARKFTRLSTQWTSVRIKFWSFTEDKFNLFTL